MHQFISGMKRTVIFGLATLMATSPLATEAATKKKTPAEPYQLALDKTSDEEIAIARGVCADGKMPASLQKVADDAELQSLHPAALPTADIYCLYVLTVSKRRGRTGDLYIDLALREQGYDGYFDKSQDRLLKNNEAWRTEQAVLNAANGGQTTYTSITGKVRALPCPLALDAGFTFAANNASAQTLALTREEATAIARQCYDPTVTEIAIRGTKMPATRAGLLAGSWFGRN